MKIQKKNWGGGGGVRVDVNEELKFLGKFQQQKLGGGPGGGGSGVGGLGEVQDGCERKIEVYVKIQKKMGGGPGGRVGGSGWM